jgi:hypothetical protein
MRKKYIYTYTRMFVESSKRTVNSAKTTNKNRNQRHACPICQKRGNKCNLKVRRNQESKVWFYALTNSGSK